MNLVDYEVLGLQVAVATLVKSKFALSDYAAERYPADDLERVTAYFGDSLPPLVLAMSGLLTTPIEEIWPLRDSKLLGHYQYYGINDNWPWLVKYRETVKRFAHRWISSRSQKRRLSHRDCERYLDRYLLVVPLRLTDLIARGRVRTVPDGKSLGCNRVDSVVRSTFKSVATTHDPQSFSSCPISQVADYARRG